MRNQTPIRVIVADGQPVVVFGTKHYLGSMPTINVVETARESDAVIEKLDRTACDVLITGYSMPTGKHGDGLKYLSYLRRRYPDLKIIVYSTVSDPSLVAEIARLGVHSVVNTSSDMTLLVSAINAVSVGRIFFSKPAAARQCCPSMLTPKEAEVLRLLASGSTPSEISRQLCRSLTTISTQKSTAKQKLGITNDLELYRFLSMQSEFPAVQRH